MILAFCKGEYQLDGTDTAPTWIVVLILALVVCMIIASNAKQ